MTIKLTDDLLAVEILKGTPKIELKTEFGDTFLVFSSYDWDDYNKLPSGKEYEILRRTSEIITQKNDYTSIDNDFSVTYGLSVNDITKLDPKKEYIILKIK